MHLRLNNQRGDTLVEVTLAVAILAAVLASAYAITSRAAKAGQAAKERTQGVALVQQQAEIIESFAIRDWDSFVNDFKNNSVGENHYNLTNWRSSFGQMSDPLGSTTAADFKVYYTAECSEQRIGTLRSCGSILNPADIRRK